MILVLEDKITKDQKGAITSLLLDDGCVTREIIDAGKTLVGIIAKNKRTADQYQQMAGVAQVRTIKTSQIGRAHV